MRHLYTLSHNYVRLSHKVGERATSKLTHHCRKSLQTSLSPMAILITFKIDTGR